MKQLFQNLFLSFICFQYVNASQNLNHETHVSSRECDPASIVENVSVIHGDYSQLEIDLVVPAPDPLIISRYYSSQDSTQFASLGGWRFNPHCFLYLRKNPKNKHFEKELEHTFVSLGNPDGSILTYVGSINPLDSSKKTLFSISTDQGNIGFTNTSKGEINSWTNFKNNKLYFDSESNSFELFVSLEGKRFYSKHPFLDYYYLTHESLPSGNKIFYEYNEEGRLVSLTESNASEDKILGWIKISYENGIFIETSNRKFVEYTFEQDASGFELLTEVKRSDKPDLFYQYQTFDNKSLLIKKILPEGRFEELDYYLEKSNKHKVRSITVPVTPTEFTTTHFFYENGHTEVQIPENRKIIYQINEDLQLIAIEEYLDAKLYRITKKSWGNADLAGNLISTSLEDGSGNTFYYKQFVYDKLNNITEEREYGNITGADPNIVMIDNNGSVINQHGHRKNCYYFFGDKTYGFFQADTKGSGIKYWYKKGTNLLIQKFVLTKGSLDNEKETVDSGIKQRYFYTYNEDAVLIQEVIDDGKTPTLNDLTGITQRTITTFYPKQDLPNLGATEVVEHQCYSLSKKSNFLLKKISYHFDDQGNIVSESVYDSNEEYQYSINKSYENGLVVQETDPLNNGISYSYDLNQNLIQKSYSATGITFHYEYDLKNRLIHTIEKTSSGDQFDSYISYDKRGFKISEIDRLGNETSYVNDDLGRPIYVAFGEICDSSKTLVKPTYTYTYDLFNNPISVTDPKNRILSKTYTVKGYPSKIYHLDGTQEIFVYDSSGSLYQHYDRNGTLQLFEYDEIGRVNHHQFFKRDNLNKDPVKKQSYYYNSFHKIYELDEKDNRTFYTYDEAGRIASYKKDNRKIEFTYDSLGRTHRIKKWKSSDTFSLEIKEYDLLGRVVEEKIEDTYGKTLIRKRYVYNRAGQLAQIIGYPQNQESVLVEYKYDNFGRLCLIRNAINHVSSISYDDFYVTEFGQKAQKRIITDSSNNQTEEVYDSNENLIRLTKKDSCGQTISDLEMSYDSVGNKILERSLIFTSNDLQGVHETSWVFNQADQLESFILANNTVNECVSRFSYNSFGELTTRYNPGSQEPVKYQYDLSGNLESVLYKEGNKQVKYKLSYDNRNNLTGMTQDSVFMLSYTFDPHNLPLTETIKDRFGSYQVKVSYDGEGKIQTLQIPDGSFISYTYEGPFVKKITRFSKDKKEVYSYQISARDLMGNILEEILPGDLGKRKQFWDKSGQKIEISSGFFHDKVIENGYDLLHNILKRQITLNNTVFEIDYSYNNLGQLTSEKGEIEYSYSYDSIGNRIEKNNSKYKVNNLNQLIETERASYTYHSNGTLASKKTKDGSWTYTTNGLNQVSSMQDNDQNLITFTYDLTGKRLNKQILSAGKKQKISRFFYLGESEIGSVDENGAVIELKIPSDPNIPESPCIAIEIKNHPYIPMYDLQGNIACLTDHQTNETVEFYRYSGFGEEEIRNEKGVVIAHSSVGNPWRYRSKRVDQETNLIYFGYRYYDPQVGRWISLDPEGTLDGPNLYTFVQNNPLTYVDYFGLNSKINENCDCDHSHPGWLVAPVWCSCICGKSDILESLRSKRGNEIQNAIYSMQPTFATAGIHDLFSNHSTSYEIGSFDSKNGGIGFINGIANSLEEAKKHALAISQYAHGAKVQGSYNATHTPAIDIMECILAHKGIYTPPVKMLKKQWNNFIKTHGPNAKFLQICHSGGAIHVLNALLTSPKEVRDRIIVLAISPGAIVPKNLCHQSYNYASKRDFVPLVAAAADILHANELIFLDPHKDASLLDHGFDSPTFQKVIKNRIIQYVSLFGE